MLTILPTAAALFLLLLVMVVAFECVLGVLPLQPVEPSSETTMPRSVVLVPAHDEHLGIEQTVHQLRAQLGPTDRLLVVADNCTDATADLARKAGAEVIERQDKAQRGKGYAISFGVEHLGHAPPDVVVIVDADCVLSDGALATLSSRAHQTGRPVQAEYLFTPPNQSGMTVVSALATIIRNQTRPRGLLRLDLPCHLTGSGMAIPWDVMAQCPPMHGYIVEDMLMGVEFALVGRPPLHCPDATVRSFLPDGLDATLQQRTRWEHGHLTTLLAQVPRLLAAGLRRRDKNLLALGLDLMVPPLALLVLLHVALVVVSVPLGVFGSAWLPFGIVGASVVSLGAAVCLGWFRFGRPEIPFRYVAQVPLYVWRKVPMYLSFLRGRRQTDWQRTER